MSTALIVLRIPPHGGVTFVRTGSERRQVRSLEIVRVNNENANRGKAAVRVTKRTLCQQRDFGGGPYCVPSPVWTRDGTPTMA